MTKNECAAPKYYSTRASKNQSQENQSIQKISFTKALLQGLAPDGGLYVPDSIPKLPSTTQAYVSETQVAPQKIWSFTNMAQEVLWAWLCDEMRLEPFQNIVTDALNFPVPITQLENNIFVVELFHGPTLAFKDFGARTMARFMNHFLKAQGSKLTILVATSGDTGCAVADGFAGLDNIDVVLLYPKGKVSNVQERQLIVKRTGVQALAVEGNFDDCQRMVKEAFLSEDLTHIPLSSANSINIGRLLPQMLYYIWAVAELTQQEYVNSKNPLNICVPSGNLGNLTAGILAARMGLPVHRFLAIHNANDFFPNYLAGEVEEFAFKPTTATLSNAMDVGAPSNFERLLELLDTETIQNMIYGSSIDDATTKQLVAHYAEQGENLCPHTAVGVAGIARYRQATGDQRPVALLATAHPAKFPAVFTEVGKVAPQDAGLEALFNQPTNVVSIAPKLEALQDYLLSRG